jgi:hypothetical protein
VQNAVRQLKQRRQLIAVTHGGPTAPPVYEVLTPWVRSPGQGPAGRPREF